MESTGKGLCFDDAVLRASEIEFKRVYLDDVVLPLVSGKGLFLVVVAIPGSEF